MSGIVVVGAGQAGASLVGKLRSLGYGGRLTLIGSEPVLPHQRPPLSKGYLLGEMRLDRLFLKPETFYSSRDIVLRLGESVSSIDTSAKIVYIGDEDIEYGQLALTTGSDNRL